MSSPELSSANAVEFTTDEFIMNKRDKIEYPTADDMERRFTTENTYEDDYGHFDIREKYVNQVTVRRILPLIAALGVASAALSNSEFRQDPSGAIFGGLKDAAALMNKHFEATLQGLKDFTDPPQGSGRSDSTQTEPIAPTASVKLDPEAPESPTLVFRLNREQPKIACDMLVRPIDQTNPEPGAYLGKGQKVYFNTENTTDGMTVAEGVLIPSQPGYYTCDEGELGVKAGEIEHPDSAFITE